VSLRQTTVALKNIISFASSIDKQGKETYGLKKISKEDESELKSFYMAISKLFCKKMLRKLMQDFTIKNNELIFSTQFNSKPFLAVFHTR
jgi:hypothetical protein